MSNKLEQECDTIHTAIEGGEDNLTENIIKIICEKTNDDRQKLKEKYISLYGVNLSEALNKKIKGDLYNLMNDLLKTPIDYDAEAIFTAIEGIGTDDDVLIEIISTREGSHLAQVNKRYNDLYKKEKIEEAIIGDTSGAYQKLLISMIQGKRRENPYPNTKKMNEAVEEIKNADKNMKESILVKHFGSSSYSELCTICYLYERKYKEPFENYVKEFGGDTKKLFVSLMDYITDSGSYFAKIINKFKPKDLNRIFVTRSEVDMDNIRKAYKELYQVELTEDIKAKIKDDYQKALLILAQK